jgi:FAD synthase
MRQWVDGPPTGDHAALVGVWDPVCVAQGAFFRTAVEQARRRDLKVLVVTLHPDPVAELRGHAAYPGFHDWRARLSFQEGCGVDGRMVVELDRREVEEEGADYLLDRITRLFSVRLLLLKPGQSLGRGERGNLAAIRAYGGRAGIDVETVPGYQVPRQVPEARKHLQAGELGRAARILGGPLYWGRPQGDHLALPWPPGPYLAAPVRRPWAAAEEEPRLPVRLRPWRGGSRLRWPDPAVTWLAFGAGPAELS